MKRLIQPEQLSRILALFPSMEDITEEDWSLCEIRDLQMEPNFVIKEGHFLEYVVLILEGTVRMYKISPGGQEITLFRIHSGECCSLMSQSILGEVEYEASACVETAGSVLMIPSENFRNWMERYL